MRILHVISTVAPSSGGTTSVIASLTAEQVKAGHSVTICTTNRGNPTSEQLDDETIRNNFSSEVTFCVFPSGLHQILYSRSMALWLRKQVKNYDLVNVHGLYRFPPTWAAYQARKQSVPYIIKPHGSLDPYVHGKSSRSLFLKRMYEKWFDLPNLHNAGAIHYITLDEKDRASHLELKAPSFVIPSAIDWAQYQSIPNRGILRSKWKLGDAPLVLFLGRINFKKGLDLLVPAFARVRERHPKARMVIAGPDNEGYGAKVRGWVAEQGLNDAVHFVESLQGAEVKQAYVDADVFALPSYTENFGMTVVESLACGTPVVISDQVNIHREVATAGAGLVTRCDVAEVADALDELLCDAPRRQAMGIAGRELVRQKWAWDVVACGLVHEYEAVIKRHTHRAKGES